MSATGSRAPTGACGRPAPGLAFDPAALPKAAPAPSQTAEQLQQLEAGLRERDEKLAALLADKTALDEELKRLRAEVAAAKQAAAAQPDTHDYSEAETRDYFIDLLLKEAGWPLDQPRDREFEVSGMPNTAGQGLRRLRALGRRRQAARARRGQAHAARCARRPAAGQALRRLPGAAVRPAAAHLLLQRLRALALGRHPLPAARGAGLLQEGGAGAADPAARRRASRWRRATINPTIVERYYQTRGIRRIAEAFERDHDRKALLVMATGAGKTRTVIALSRPADALQLGQARAVPRRPRGAGEPGGERLQAPPARCVAGEPRHREGRRGARLRLDLSDDDGADRRDDATASAASASATSTS